MSSIIKVDQIQLANGSTPTAGDLGLNQAGTVLQVVQTVKRDTWSYTATNSWGYISGLSATITPKSTNSKILITVSIHQGESSDAFPFYMLTRDQADIDISDYVSPGRRSMFTGVRTQASPRDQYLFSPVNFTYLDSPSSTSALTYEVKVNPMATTSRTVYINRSQTIGDANQGTAISTYTLMEIAG